MTDPTASRPRISVVIPHNYENPTSDQGELLRETLRSVLTQTMGAWEAIVVKNRSDNQTSAIADGFGDPRILYVDCHNNGVIAASRNKGTELARSEWVAFLDSDDLWTPDKLARCLAVIDAGTGIDLVSHREVMVKDGRPLGLTPRGSDKKASYNALLYRGNCLSPTAVVARKSKLEAVGGFSEDPALVSAEDYDLWLRLARFGIRMAFIDEPLSQYTLHGASASASIRRHLDANLKVLEQHFAELGPPLPFEWLLRRRARARMIYGAARASQKAGRRGDAVGFLAESLSLFPLAPKAYAALLLTFLTGGSNSR